MQLSPRLRAFLDRLGVNTTRLQWRLYNLERRWQTPNAMMRVPASLQWLRFPHKFCPKCKAVVPREDKSCPSCGRRVHSMPVYRTLRLLGLSSPGGVSPTVYAFLAVMVFMYLLTIMVQGPSAIWSPSWPTLIAFGAWNPLSIVGYGQWWRVMSFGLVHIGLIHILFNGIGLSQVGPVIEDEIGPKRMLAVITFTQLTSAIGTHLWYLNYHQVSPHFITAGASGWLFGLLGFGIGYFHRSGGGGRELRDFFVQWTVYGILFGILVNANNAAHIGGMAGGILAGLIPSQRRQWEHVWKPIWAAAFWISAALWLVTLVFMARFIWVALTVGQLGNQPGQ